MPDFIGRDPESNSTECPAMFVSPETGDFAARHTLAPGLFGGQRDVVTPEAAGVGERQHEPDVLSDEFCSDVGNPYHVITAQMSSHRLIPRSACRTSGIGSRLGVGSRSVRRYAVAR